MITTYTDLELRVFKNAVTQWGVDAQLNQAIEECAELIQAINKFRRINDRDNLLEEIADVEIMIGQLKIILNDSASIGNIVDSKINKLIRKL